MLILKRKRKFKGGIKPNYRDETTIVYSADCRDVMSQLKPESISYKVSWFNGRARVCEWVPAHEIEINPKAQDPIFRKVGFLQKEGNGNPHA